MSLDSEWATNKSRIEFELLLQRQNLQILYFLQYSFSEIIIINGREREREKNKVKLFVAREPRARFFYYDNRSNNLWKSSAVRYNFHISKTQWAIQQCVVKRSFMQLQKTKQTNSSVSASMKKISLLNPSTKKNTIITELKGTSWALSVESGRTSFFFKERMVYAYGILNILNVYCATIEIVIMVKIQRPKYVVSIVTLSSANKNIKTCPPK